MASKMYLETGSGIKGNEFIRNYFQLREKPTTTVRFFERLGFNNSPYYTVYGPDATLAGKYFQATDNVKDLKLENSVLNEVEERWTLACQGLAGNLCELREIIFAGADDFKTVVGIKISEHGMAKIVGVACVNTEDCVISLLEFEDNEHFCNLESVLVQVAAKEVIVCTSGVPYSDTERLYQLLRRDNRILVSSRQDFDSKNINQDLASLMRPVAGCSFSFASHPDHNKKHAAMALAGTIKHLKLLADDKFANQFSLEKFGVHLHVKTDDTACGALDLASDNGRTSGCKNMIMEEKISKLESRMSSRMSSWESRMSSLESRMSSLESRMSSLESRMSSLESQTS